MFTNNYIKFRKAAFTTGSSYSTPLSLVNAAGSSVTTYVSAIWNADIGYWMVLGKCRAITASASSYTLTNTTYPGLYFGAGSTAATKNDYCLESPITTGLSITNPSSATWLDDGNGVYSAVADFIVRNTTNEPITVREVGVFTPVGNQNTTAPNGAHSAVYYVLMERTVLDAPVTIPAGEAKLVSYKVTFNQPSTD